MNNASNAVLAMCRSMYGKRLTKQQYDELLGLKSVNEVASYLKTKTPYGKAFQNSNAVEYTAKLLDDTVDNYHSAIIAKLCRLEISIGQKFYEYYIVKGEIEQILKCTMLILGGNKDKYLLDLRGALDKHLGIDLFSLGKANTLSEIADALKNTKYEKLYRSLIKNESVSYLSFETAFYSYLADFQSELISGSFKGREKKEIYNIMSTANDVSLIENRIRVFTYYSDIHGIRASLITDKMTRLSQSELIKIASSMSISELEGIIKKTVYKNLTPLKSENISRTLDGYLYNYYKKQIRFSVYPSAVMYSFIFLSSTEVSNLKKIIEGKRYGLYSEDIKKELLI